MALTKKMMAPCSVQPSEIPAQPVRVGDGVFRGGGGSPDKWDGGMGGMDCEAATAEKPR